MTLREWYESLTPEQQKEFEWRIELPLRRFLHDAKRWLAEAKP